MITIKNTTKIDLKFQIDTRDITLKPKESIVLTEIKDFGFISFRHKLHKQLKFSVDNWGDFNKLRARTNNVVKVSAEVSNKEASQDTQNITRTKEEVIRDEKATKEKSDITTNQEERIETHDKDDIRTEKKVNQIKKR